MTSAVGRLGTSLGVGEQAKDDLELAGLVVARVTEFAQRAVAALAVSGGQIVKHQAALGEVAFGQFLLEARLLEEQPVQGLTEFRLMGGIHLEQLAGTAVESVGVQAASGVEDGVKLEDTQAAENGGAVTVGKLQLTGPRTSVEIEDNEESVLEGLSRCG